MYPVSAASSASSGVAPVDDNGGNRVGTAQVGDLQGVEAFTTTSTTVTTTGKGVSTITELTQHHNRTIAKIKNHNHTLKSHEKSKRSHSTKRTQHSKYA
ncbi:hypothetical protein [Candidatus Ichthyocystis sparus]|uniref:hypothetical protein n=1 Tax=Candidatus Ichthyocystis sparus TaxID=1561004 RepID=UPI000B80BCD4|nr:hypothetical protein [Candidatus Ichthyocystis sparus]